MSDLRQPDRLQPSLLDRLTDANPAQPRESLDQQVLTMAQLRRAVLRDVGWLFNATNLATVVDLEPFPHVMHSALNYGIPGLAGQTADQAGAMALEQSISTALRAFEPRIKAESVSVTARPAPQDGSLPTLSFTVHGELWARPVPQQLFLETSIEVETRMAVVTEGKAGR